MILAKTSSVAALPGDIPGPGPMFLLGWRGNVLRCARDPLGYLTALHRDHGDVVAVLRGGNSFSTVTGCPGTVAAFGPRYNREILGNPGVFHMSLVTGLEGGPLERLGAGMFNCNGEKHGRIRREMAPAFHRRSGEAHHRDLVALTRQALDTWRPGRRLDVLGEMQRLSFRVACKTFFGLPGSADVDTLGSLIRRWVHLAYTPAVRLLPVDLPFAPYRQFLRASRQLDSAVAALCRREQPAEEGTLLGALFRAADGGLSEGECVGQTLSLLLASHDTTAAALTWTLFLLSQHPQVTAGLLDELEGQLGGEAPTLEQLGRLRLLEDVVRESLRLLPPVPLAGRVAVGPVALGPYHLPRGTEVLYSQYVTHRLPELYAQPAKFLPGRWDRLRPSPYEYLPFGAGPRRCAGAHLAMGQIKTVLAMALQRYRLQPVPAARVDYRLRLTLQPKGGLPMVVCNQDHRFAAGKTDVGGNIRQMVELTS